MKPLARGDSRTSAKLALSPETLSHLACLAKPFVVLQAGGCRLSQPTRVAAPMINMHRSRPIGEFVDWEIYRLSTGPSGYSDENDHNALGKRAGNRAVFRPLLLFVFLFVLRLIVLR
jgi:hypothetical protein